MTQATTRNFCIIAHVDHGKSTLADRLLELTGTIEKRAMREQVLDAMDLERERGITIKLTPVTMEYAPAVQTSGVGSRVSEAARAALHPTPYTLNLIDTPGHVDFSYEVSRSLAAVEGAVLLVDATQGTQAQTLANLELARRAGLVIIPVVNKIDLPQADVAGVRRELSALTGVPEEDVLCVSGKTGEGVPELLREIVMRIPPPRGEETKAFRALVFDSAFDPFKGVVAYIRVVDGQVARNTPLAFAASTAEASSVDVGIFTPEPRSVGHLSAGSIGYVATGLRDVSLARVGDTILTRSDRGRVAPLPGYAVPHANVYAGMYPVAGEEFPVLRDALAKLRLSDASLTLEPEHVPALGSGYRCGFLGLLHMDIVRERLEREHGVRVTLTVPSVAYTVVTSDGETALVRSATEFPDPSRIRTVLESWVRLRVLARRADLGAVLQMLATRGSTPPTTETMAGDRVAVVGDVPLREVVSDFHDDLKAATAGYGSFSLALLDQRPVDLVKVGVLVNHEPADALSFLVPAGEAAEEGRRVVESLKDAIPRHLFAVPIQAVIGGKVVARETVQALRKDVTGHLYGGDVTRKKKLLEKQKKGKKRLATGGRVTIPPDAYLAVLTSRHAARYRRNGSAR